MPRHTPEDLRRARDLCRDLGAKVVTEDNVYRVAAWLRQQLDEAEKKRKAPIDVDPALKPIDGVYGPDPRAGEDMAPRVRHLEAIALELARHRFKASGFDHTSDLMPENMITKEDRSVALRVVRMAEPLLPAPPVVEADDLSEVEEGA